MRNHRDVAYNRENKAQVLELGPDMAGYFALTPIMIHDGCIMPHRDGGAILVLYAIRPIHAAAPMIRYLFGPGAKFVSGQSIHVNGA